MSELRAWKNMKHDNDGAAWINEGEFCKQYTRTSTDEVNAILDEERGAGLKEWQLTGFNGCWSCDKCIECHFDKQR